MLDGIAMALPAVAEVEQDGGGAEDEREGEVVGAEIAAVHLGVEGEDFVEGAEVGVGAEEGVVEEGVWVGDCVEELAGVGDGGGEGGGEGEKLGGGWEVEVEAMGDEEGVDALERGEGGARIQKFGKIILEGS